MHPDEIIENQLIARIEAKTNEVYRQHSVGDPNLCTSLRRAATSILMYAKDHDQIKNYTVTCDPDTLDEDGCPVVDIKIEFFKRVREMKYHFGE